jgi:hypothetical protein
VNLLKINKIKYFILPIQTYARHSVFVCSSTSYFCHCPVSEFIGTLCIEIVRTSIVDATQDHCRTLPDKNTTWVSPGTRHKSEHVDTPSTVGHGLAAPAPTARNTATVTSRHIVLHRSLSLVALAHTLPPCSPSPRRSYSAPALINAGYSPSLVRFSSLDTLDAGLLTRSLNDARATKNTQKTRQGVLQHGEQQNRTPKQNQAKQTAKKRK